jgi:hypothetical protein
MGPTVDTVTRIILAVVTGVPMVTTAATRTPCDLAGAMWGPAINAVAWIILATTTAVAAGAMAVANAP